MLRSIAARGYGGATAINAQAATRMLAGSRKAILSLTRTDTCVIRNASDMLSLCNRVGAVRS